MPRRPELYRMAMLDLYCDSFPSRHLTLDLDESFDRGEQELRKFNAYYDDFLPIHIFDTSGRLVVSVLREAATPSEILTKRVVGHLRERFPRIRLRGDSHYACPEVMTLRSLCDRVQRTRKRGCAAGARPGHRVHLRPVRNRSPWRRRLEARTAARYAARPSHPGSSSAATWTSGAVLELPAPDRVEAGPDGVDTRYIVTNLRPGAAALRAKILPERRMENLLKSFTWPPIGPPAREPAPTKSGSFCMAPPIGCSGRSRASCRSARPGASSTPCATG